MGDDDPIARMRAEMDQSREAIKELAGTVAAYYLTLVAEGVPVPQALGITQAFVLALSQQRPSGDGE